MMFVEIKTIFNTKLSSNGPAEVILVFSKRGDILSTFFQCLMFFAKTIPKLLFNAKRSITSSLMPSSKWAIIKLFISFLLSAFHLAKSSASDSKVSQLNLLFSIIGKKIRFNYCTNFIVDFCRR